MKEYVSAPKPHISTRLPYIREFQRKGHKIDRKLLDECAYYPRGGCQFCRWDWPFPKCQYAHILVETRCAGVRGWKEDRSTKEIRRRVESRMKKGKKEVMSERFWDELPKELREELKRIMEEAADDREED